MKHTIADACIKGDYIYFFENEAQALCAFFIPDERFEVLAVNNEKKFDSYHIFYEKDSLYMTSLYTTSIMKYDMISGNLKWIPDDLDGELQKNHMYDYHMISNNKIWNFPNDQKKPVILFDLDTGVFIENTVLKDTKIVKDNENTITRFSSGFLDVYWSVFYNSNIFLKNDLGKNNVQMYKISDTTVHAEAIMFDGEYLWITSANDGSIFKCSEEGTVIGVFNKNKELSGEVFSRLYCIEQYIIGVPRFGKYILFINKLLNEEKRVYLRDIDPDFDIDTNGGSKILKCLKYKEKLFFFGFGIDAFIMMDINGDNACNIGIKYDDQDWNKIRDYKKVLVTPIVSENEITRLKELVVAVVSDNFKMKSTSHHVMGKLIYKSLTK